jgi:hypothetical protein
MHNLIDWATILIFNKVKVSIMILIGGLVVVVIQFLRNLFFKLTKVFRNYATQVTGFFTKLLKLLLHLIYQ